MPSMINLPQLKGTKKALCLGLFLVSLADLSCERLLELVFQTEEVKEKKVSPEKEVKEAEEAPEPEDWKKLEPIPVKESDGELKAVMEEASKYMKSLDNAIKSGNWPATGKSAEKLEELIGRRCVNLYVKMHPDTPQEFVNISQRFYDDVLKLLMAQRYQKTELAETQFQKMKASCEECHQRFRKERG